MTKLISTYLIALVCFFAMDMLWLGIVAKNFYKQRLGFLFSDTPNWAAAIVFYLIYIGGILFFAVNPAFKESNWQTALINGAVLGGLCYATYDLTNMALINKWPLEITIVDIIWGMVLTGSVGTVTYLIVSKLF